MKVERLTALDGLRGVAILSVMGFHYLGLYAGLTPGIPTYPYASHLAASVFRYGWLGVELFFVISGFVIALTLEKCATPLEFATRRFARLWPALLVCSIATFIFSSAVGSPMSDFRPQHWYNFFPTLTLTPREWWSFKFPAVDFVDRSYWTLIAEVRFYLVAAMIFWLFKRKNLAVTVSIFVIANITIRSILKHTVGGDQAYSAITLPDFMPWFAAGVVFFELYSRKLSRRVALILLLPMYVFIARNNTFDIQDNSSLVISGIALAIFAVFWLLTESPTWLQIFESRWLVTIGAWSYSIYLLHQEIGLALLFNLAPTKPIIAQAAMVVAVTMTIIALGSLSFHFIEGPARRWITVSSRY
jgi:peptidoglycan/LPS O-acetylase OafA/YrhL